MAYAYAKRGQILLCEHWALCHPTVKVVSCHPGWTQTEGVDAAFGSNKSKFEPLRSIKEGSEGIEWLCVALSENIVSGAFYLDRYPQTKHLAGAFFSEGSYTKNSSAEIADMIHKLQAWSIGDRPTPAESERIAATKLPLKALQNISLNIPQFMGKWYVLACIPTRFEVGASNCIENYEWDERNSCIRIRFDYFPKKSVQMSSSHMKAFITNSPMNTQWAVRPKIGIYLPLDLAYLVIDLPEDFSYVSIGVPSRDYLWIMTREKPLYTDSFGVVEEPPAPLPAFFESRARQEAVLDTAIRHAELLGYNRQKIIRVPWIASD